MFAPKSVAVIGATEAVGSVGRMLMENLRASEFGGMLFPVNPKRASVLDIKAFPKIGDMPAVVYLAAYWPGAPEEFFAPLDTTMEEELARYDGVIFFESAAVGGMGIEGGNPVRNETLEQAAALDANCGRTIRVSSWCGTIRRSLRTISFDLAELDTMVSELAAVVSRRAAGRRQA